MFVAEFLMCSWNKQNLVYIHRLHYPVTVLGRGKRVGIWFQGCTIRCQGCINEDLQDQNEESAVNQEQLFSLLAAYQNKTLDGITITGGEPFNQPDGLMQVIKITKRLGFGEILVYSGYEYDYLMINFPALLKNIDILISGPFIESMPTNKIWRGSDNQKVYLLSPAAQKFYPVSIDTLEYQDDQRPIQFGFADETLYLIGIPRRGDIKRLRQYCEKYGVVLS